MQYHIQKDPFAINRSETTKEFVIILIDFMPFITLIIPSYFVKALPAILSHMKADYN